MKREGKTIQSMMESVRYYLKGIYFKFQSEHLLFYASGVAFNGLLCVLPFLLLATSSLGLFLSSSELAIRNVHLVLDHAFPQEHYAQEMKRMLERVVDDIIRHRSSYGLVGFGILTWTAASLFSALRSLLNTIYSISTRKLLVINILEEIALVMLLGLFFFTANAFIWLSSLVEPLLAKIPWLSSLRLELIRGANALVIAYIPAFVMFFLVNRFVPDKTVTSKVAVIASLVTTILWWAAGKLFVLYLSTFHSYSMLYGTYAFLFVFIFWVYYSSVSFVIGGVVGQLYRERNIRV